MVTVVKPNAEEINITNKNLAESLKGSYDEVREYQRMTAGLLDKYEDIINLRIAQLAIMEKSRQ